MSLTDKQKALRRIGIGSSEIAAVAGLSEYATPLDVWRSKVEGLELEETPAMRRGRLLEPAIAQWYAEETGATLTEPGTIRHPKSKIALATPDRIATLGGFGSQGGVTERVLEIKTANLRQLAKWGEPGTDQVPEAYLAQVTWEMACAGIHVADLAVLLAGDDFRVYRLTHDPELEEMLLETAERFWRDHVETKKPPPIDGSDSCKEWLAHKFPTGSADAIESTEEAEEWAGEVRRLSIQVRDMEEAKTEAENHLKALIGNASGMVGSRWSISWKEQKGRAVVDVEALAKEAGIPKSLIEKHTHRTPFRAFRFTSRE